MFVKRNKKSEKIMRTFFFISIAVIAYTYIGYGIILWVCVKIKELAFKGGSPQHGASEYPEMTLLIAAYNESAIIDEKMENIHRLSYPKDRLTVVWVTDGSSDSTNDKLARYGDVTVLYQPQRQGKTAAVNRGMSYVATPIVAFTDANTMLNEGALEELAKCFDDENVGCVAGEKRIAVKAKDGAAAGGEGIYWRYESTLKRLDSRLYTAVGAAGELFAIRRELFEPMEADTLLDDFILSMKIAQRGYKIAYCDRAYACETGSANMEEEQKRKVRIAAGGLQSIIRLRGLLNVFKTPVLSFQYVSHRVLRWSVTPVLLFLLLPVNLVIVMMHPQDTFFIVMLALQVLFYVLGLWGYYLSLKEIKNKILYIPYYFLFMNWNVIRGFAYLSKRKGNGAWEKAKRAAN